MHNLHNIELLELTLEQRDVEDALIDASAIQEIVKLGDGDDDHAAAAEESAQVRALEWFNKLTSLAQRTATVSPQTHCEVRLLQNHAVLARASQTQLMAATGRGAPLVLAGIRNRGYSVKFTGEDRA